MKNKRIRETLSHYGLFQYQLAEILKISEFTLVRHLRKELPEEEQERIVQLIMEYCRGDVDGDQ